jgi:hypothetical protein
MGIKGGRVALKKAFSLRQVDLLRMNGLEERTVGSADSRIELYSLYKILFSKQMDWWQRLAKP